MPMEAPLATAGPLDPPTPNQRRKPARTPRTGRPAGVRDVTPRRAPGFQLPVAVAATPHPVPMAAPGASFPQPVAVHPSALTTRPIPPPKHPRLQADDFFKYWQQVEASCPSRATVYVYRVWPVIDRERHGLPNNIDKLVLDDGHQFDFERWKDEFLRLYGSGDYKVMLNAMDPNIGRDRNYCSARIEKLKDPDYPPVLDYNHLVLDDKDNRTYVEQLKQKQILTLDGKPAGANGNPQPSQQQQIEDEQMSTVVEKAMDMTAAQIDAANSRAAAAERENAELKASLRRLEDRINSTPVAASQPVDQSAITQQFLGTVLDGFKRTAEAMDQMRSKELERTGKMADPMSMLKETADLMKTFQGGAGDSQALSMQLLQIVITQSQAHSAEMAKIVEAISNRSAAPPPKSLVETVTELRAIKDAMSDGGGGQQVEMYQGDDGEHRPRRNQHWSEILIPMLAPLVAPLLQRVMGGNQPQGYQPGYPPQALPPGQYPPQQYAQQPPPQYGQQTQAPPPPTGPVQMPSTSGGYEQLHELLAHFQPAIINAMNLGQPGEAFADWVCEGYGVMQFQQFKAVGFQAIWTAVTTYPPLWSQIGPMEVHFQNWLREVLAFDPNQQEGDDTEELEVPGLRPAGVPASAKPTGSYNNPAVTHMMSQG